VHADPQATVYAVVGCAGAGFSNNTDLSHPPAWSECVMNQYGYARLVAPNASQLRVEFVSNVDGRVLDRILLLQTDPTAPWSLPATPTAASGIGAGAVAAAVAGGLAGAAAVLFAFRWASGQPPTPAGCRRALQCSRRPSYEAGFVPLTTPAEPGAIAAPAAGFGKAYASLPA